MPSAESDAEINLSLTGDGYDVFSRAKRASELQCPGIVSCANVMAIASRDLVGARRIYSRHDGLMIRWTHHRFALAPSYNAGDGHIFDVVAYKFSEAPESAAGAL
ncbi:hypothetical protein D5086_010333 [Populus alba]|uniref:Uncharacterized protein n=1 Tax=Populus alba TaxID=43335 RepID=A0ACC4CAM9_POPAL